VDSRAAFVRIDHRPTELPQVGLLVTSVRSSLLYSSRQVMGLATFPFTTVQDDPDIMPVLKFPAQLFVPI
jgi:hypothetical protein